MSAVTPILSSAVPFAISSDGGVTFKNVVCKKTWNLGGSAILVQEETDCDVLTAVGAIKNDFGFEFVLNSTPNGASEWGSDDIMNFFQNKTLLVVKTSNGSTYFRSGSGYIGTYRETAAQGGMLNGSGTFNVSGSLDTTL